MRFEIWDLFEIWGMRFVLACLNLTMFHMFLDVEEKTFDKCFRVCRMHAECM